MNINDLIAEGIVPDIHVSKDEDETIIIEWIFSGVRLGFNIEKDDKASGWHVVSKQITACGPLLA